MKEIKINPFTKLANSWALVTAGTNTEFNSMTISWGAFGTIWGKDTITIYIRPTRHTLKFLKENSNFTVSFYDEKYKDALKIMGTKSGKDIDKVKETNFTPKFLEDAITYEEANDTFVCKKMYMQKMDKNAFPEEAVKFYNTEENKEPHYIIIGEVIKLV